jgi:NADH:ubiquinone oxidoreductase subunit 4 (subunit M)
LSCFKFGWCFFVSLFCIRQTDLKSLIAYSSVAHISIDICGIVTLSYWGFVDLLPVLKSRHYKTIIFIISVKHFRVWNNLLVI